MIVVAGMYAEVLTYNIRYSLPMASFSFGLVLLFSSGIVLDPDYYTI